jgi:hypothetical protein
MGQHFGYFWSVEEMVHTSALDQPEACRRPPTYPPSLAIQIFSKCYTIFTPPPQAARRLPLYGQEDPLGRKIYLSGPARGG